MLVWFLYINYTYMTPEHGNNCVEEMKECKKSVYTHFGGI